MARQLYDALDGRVQSCAHDALLKMNAVWGQRLLENLFFRLRAHGSWR